MLRLRPWTSTTSSLPTCRSVLQAARFRSCVTVSLDTDLALPLVTVTFHNPERNCVASFARADEPPLRVRSRFSHCISPRADEPIRCCATIRDPEPATIRHASNDCSGGLRPRSASSPIATEGGGRRPGFTRISAASIFDERCTPT
jgi:hypothetical protein